jgi:hypothetical protein
MADSTAEGKGRKRSAFRFQRSFRTLEFCTCLMQGFG